MAPNGHAGAGWVKTDVPSEPGHFRFRTQSGQCADARSGLVLFSPGPVTGCDGLYWGFLGDEDDLVSQVDEESNAR